MTQTAREVELEAQLSLSKSARVQVLCPHAVNKGWVSGWPRDTDAAFTGARGDPECKAKKSSPGPGTSHVGFSGREEGHSLAPNQPSELSALAEVQELVPVRNKQEEASSSLILNLRDEKSLWLLSAC